MTNKPLKKERVAIMFGGLSVEHEISVITALQAIEAIDTEKYELVPVYLALNGKWYTGGQLLDKALYRRFPAAYAQLQEVTLLPDPSRGGLIELPSQRTLPVDLCFLAFHGQQGEDGCVQGLLELADLPYTGCSLLASAVAMNKYISKAVVKAHGIEVLPAHLISKKALIEDFSREKKRLLAALAYPLFVKPNHLGSSIGVSVVRKENELAAALAKVFQYDDEALVEPCIEQLLEINVAVMDGSPPTASLVEIPIAKEGTLSYEDKYLRGGAKTTRGQSSGMAGLSRVIDPIDLDPALKEKLTAQALDAFRLLGCSGVCRFDFMVDLSTGKSYYNELNPIPGSFSFYLWDKGANPILFTHLIEKLFQKAKERKETQRSLNKEFGFHTL